jgi:hypothetical protein
MGFKIIMVAISIVPMKSSRKEKKKEGETQIITKLSVI